VHLYLRDSSWGLYTREDRENRLVHRSPSEIYSTTSTWRIIVPCPVPQKCAH
jgi:hypothetical protein